MVEQLLDEELKLAAGAGGDGPALDARRGIDSRKWLAGSVEALAPLIDAGVVRADERGIEVLPRGRLLVRAVAMAFDRHLARSSSGASYSRIA